jgi:hypothetical protein
MVDMEERIHMKARIFVAMIAALGLLMPAPVLAQSVEWTRTSVTGPAPRYDHAMAYDTARGVTVLFGGLPTAST